MKAVHQTSRSVVRCFSSAGSKAAKPAPKWDYNLIDEMVLNTINDDLSEEKSKALLSRYHRSSTKSASQQKLSEALAAGGVDLTKPETIFGAQESSEEPSPAA